MTPPPKVPGYELFQCLGSGSMASVYSARSIATNESCAVKILREEWWEDATAVQLIRREARAGLHVTHPHLVRIFDAHIAHPPYFLVLDLLEGETVRERLRREYRLDLSSSLWVVRQIAESLASLHRAGFVHGDVKPENIRLINSGTAILVDLGFAHRPGENAEMMASGFVMGTANYLSPELCNTDPSDDPASDVFSLGVTMFEMLTGVLPYPLGNVEDTMIRHRDGEPANLTDYPGNWPVALQCLVLRMLERKPSARWRASAVVRHLIACEIACLRRSG